MRTGLLAGSNFDALTASYRLAESIDADRPANGIPAIERRSGGRSVDRNAPAASVFGPGAAAAVTNISHPVHLLRSSGTRCHAALRRLPVLQAGVSLLLAAGASAQSLPAASAPTGEPVLAGDIVVTAQRRTESLSKVPISVNVVSGEFLARQQIPDIKDLSRFVPNLTVTDSPGQNAVFIRGLGTGARNLLFEQAVTVQIDGLTTARAAQFVTPFFDIQRIEVLRGPQGVLFGKNSTAGAISIVTADPTRDLSGSVTGRYELEDGGFGTDAFIAGPVSDTLGFRIAVRADRLGDYLTNSNLGEEAGRVDTLAARGTLRWQPNADVDARFKLDFGSVKTDGGNLQFGACTSNRARVLSVSPTETCQLDDLTATGTADRTLTQNLTALVNSDFRLGSSTLTVIAAYSGYDTEFTRDLDATPVVAIFRQVDERFRQAFGELRLTSADSGVFNYVAGLTFQSQKIDIDDRQDANLLSLPYTNAPTAPFNPQANAGIQKFVNQTLTSGSAYAQLGYRPMDRLELIAGGRLTVERKVVDYDVVRFLFGTDTRVQTPLDVSISGRTRNETSFDPQITVQYELAERLMAYATGSIVHKAGGFNVDETNASVIDRTFEFEPERARGVEVGAKFANRLGYANLAVFSTDFTNLQVSSFDGVTTFVRNAAEARSRGVEVDALVRPNSFLTLSGSLAYLDATFTNYPGGTCTPAQAAAVAPAVCSADLSGRRLTFAPEWSGSFSTDVRIPADRLGMFVGGTTISFKSSQFSQENNDPTFAIDEIVTLDLRAGIESMDGNRALRFVARNITDEVVPSFLFAVRNAPGANTVSTPRGRLLFIEMTARF